MTTAYLHLDTWAGRIREPVELIGETPKRYRIRLLSDIRLPSRRQGRAGDEVLVPKYSISISDED